MTWSEQAKCLFSIMAPMVLLNRSVSENLTLWWKYLRLKQQETGWILSCHPANCFRALKETRPGTSVIGLSFSRTEKNWQNNSFLSDFNCKCRLFCTVWAYFFVRVFVRKWDWASVLFLPRCSWHFHIQVANVQSCLICCELMLYFYQCIVFSDIEITHCTPWKFLEVKKW